MSWCYNSWPGLSLMNKTFFDAAEKDKMDKEVIRWHKSVEQILNKLYQKYGNSANCFDTVGSLLTNKIIDYIFCYFLVEFNEFLCLSVKYIVIGKFFVILHHWFLMLCSANLSTGDRMELKYVLMSSVLDVKALSHRMVCHSKMWLAQKNVTWQKKRWRSNLITQNFYLLVLQTALQMLANIG